MYKIKLNVFTATAMFQILQVTSTDGLAVKKLRIVNKLLDSLEEGLDNAGKYTLIKSSALAENMLKRLLFLLIPMDKDKRKATINEFLSNEKNYNFESDDSVKYIFEDILASDIRRKHWIDEKVPSINLCVDKKQLEYLEEAFSEEVKFPEESAHLIVAIVDAIEDAEKIEKEQN